MIYIVLHAGQAIFATTHEADAIEFLRRNPDITCVVARRDGEVGREAYQLRARPDFGLMD